VLTCGGTDSRHDSMLPLLGLRERLHPEFDVAFISNPTGREPRFLRTNRFAGHGVSSNTELWNGFEKMSSNDWALRTLPSQRKISRRLFADRSRPAKPHEPLSYTSARQCSTQE